MAKLRYQEIEAIDDPLYDPWLDIYQKCFPLNEQMLVSNLNQMLRDRTDGVVFLVALDASDEVAAMCLTETGASAVVLWYLAVAEERRCEGIGTQVYGELVRRAHARGAALFFEVEDPAEAHEPEERLLAERRIAFYRRNGARLLGGIHYIQSVGWQPPTPMRIMAHAADPLAPPDAFDMARSLFGETVEQVGELAWE